MMIRQMMVGALVFFGLTQLGSKAFADDRILIPTSVNGHQLHLAFDTGAGKEIVVFSGVARQIGLKPVSYADSKAGTSGSVTFKVVDDCTVELFGKTFAHAPVAVIESESGSAPDIDGVIGWPALRANVVDFTPGQSVVMRNAVPPEMMSGFKLQIDTEENQLCLHLPAIGNDAGGILLVDTGDPSGVGLSKTRWLAWRAAHPRARVTLNAYFTPEVGLVVSEECWADEISLNGLVLKNVPVYESAEKYLSSRPVGYQGSLGLAALRSFRLVVDASHGVAYSQLSSGPVPAFQHNRLGAVFVPVSDSSSDLVAHVAQGSPAAEANIKDGDVLLAIDSLDVTPWRIKPGILPLNRFWNKRAGTTLRLTLRHGDVTYIESVTLRDILGPSRRR